MRRSDHPDHAAFPVTLYGQTYTDARASSERKPAVGRHPRTRHRSRLPADEGSRRPRSSLLGRLLDDWSAASDPRLPGRRRTEYIVSAHTYANPLRECDFEAIFTENSDVIRMRYGVDAGHRPVRDRRAPGSPTRSDESSATRLTWTIRGSSSRSPSAAARQPPPPPPPPPPPAPSAYRDRRLPPPTTSAAALPTRLAVCRASSACASAPRRRRSAAALLASATFAASAPGGR